MLSSSSASSSSSTPQARVLAAGNDDLKTLGRHTFTARIATGNWDAVIMSQSVFERIPCRPPDRAVHRRPAR